jgi:hypothetical protein
MKKVSLFVMLCLLSVCAFAGEIPTKAVRGKVYDKATHEVLAGVKVSVENSTQSVYTDLEGNFTLLISGQEKPVLTFSGVSYNDQKIALTSSFSDINIQLSEL